jgi:hypothetical protein
MERVANPGYTAAASIQDFLTFQYNRIDPIEVRT